MEIRIEDNLNLVHSVLQRQFKKMPHDQDYEDYYQVGCEGLIKAAAKFDPAFGCVFSTYAVPVIAGEIMRYKRDYIGNFIRIPRSVKDIMYKLPALEGLDDTEICKRLEITQEQLDRAKAAQFTVVHIDAPVGVDGDKEMSVHEKIADETDVEEEAIDNVERQTAFKLLSAALNPQQKAVALGMMQNKTQEAVGADVGLSQAQISRVIRKVEKTAAVVGQYMNGNKKPLQIMINERKGTMSKLSQQHINCIVEWMEENEGEPPVNQIWRENNLPVRNGYQTIVKSKARKLLGQEPPKPEPKPAEITPKPQTNPADLIIPLTAESIPIIAKILQGDMLRAQAKGQKAIARIDVRTEG